MNALRYARELIAFDSVSTKSNLAISDYLEDLLGQLRFRTERVAYERDGVLKVNVIGCRDAADGFNSGGIAFFGHTDVVPADDWSQGDHGPFEPTVRGNRLYGRGSTDMKGPIACMLSVADSLSGRDLKHPLFICCTADEELDHRGIKEIVRRSSIYRELTQCGARGIVGEPTEMQVVFAHKGGTQISVTSHGEAAHSSTRDGINANLAMIPFLHDVKAIHDETETEPGWMDDEFDPPSICMNIGINDHTKAVNVKAAKSVCTLCYRTMPCTDNDGLIERISNAASRHGLEFDLVGENPPFRRDPRGPFVTACLELVGGSRAQTTGFGTEAGNLTEVEHLIVLGPGSIRQAHQPDEFISLDQLAAGESGYRKIVSTYC